ncbi:MAG: fatty acid--CoA ligase [Syntrophaceae bacterium]|nr:fatty acid--CoA ligase [Syntrophaceae bacterium]
MSGRKFQPGESYNYPLIIKKLLVTPLLYAPDQEIVYRDKLRMSYRTFHERVHRLANALDGLGLKPGGTVGVLDYDSHRYLECFFAIPMMGSVLHTLNWRLSPDQILYTINHAEDDILLVHTDFLPILEAIRDRLRTVRKIILLADDAAGAAAKGAFDAEYEVLLKESSASFDFPDFDENTRATTFYTTGTTGLPKGVYFTHRQLVMHTLCGCIALGAYDSACRFRSSDVYMPMTPMFHVHAWGIPYIATLLGVKQVYPGRYEPEMLLKLILTEKVTLSHCVPTILHMLVSSPAVKKLDLSRWRVVIGGARFPKGLAQAAMELGIEVMSGFGMSETCPIISLATLKPGMLGWPKEKQVDVLIKTGLPIPLVEMEIVDPAGKPLPHDGKTTGELVMRAPWLTAGYVKDPEQSKLLWPDGWLHGGDIANVDPEGYIQITDRLKDVIKTGGEWISSLELENLLSQHPAVSETAAIGVPDEKWGERPMMLVVLKPDAKASPGDLKAFMQSFVETGKIPRYGLPDRYEIVAEIPKTSVGKINKVRLREMYAK